ncbi:MAG TPA: tyrosine-type recombinase/integrase, partial [Gemmatimonadaceae bacterium]
LERNPLRGLALPREESPRRPVLGHEQYEALRAITSEVSPLFALALVLAHETGHRIGSIRQLRWSDVDTQAATVRWRAETDKIGAEHVTPLTAPAAEALDRQRRSAPAIGDAWVFPAPGDGGQPCSRHLLRDWWERAAVRVGLPAGERFGYHSLRRQFASELKETPLADLAYLGGWKDPQTILKCYQRPDADTMRRALEQRRPLRAGSAR